MDSNQRIQNNDKANEKGHIRPPKAQPLVPASRPLNRLTIQQARLEPKALKAEEMGQLQRDVGNRAVDRLLLRPLQTHHNNTLQRMKMYPFDAEGQQLPGEVQEVDLTESTYKQLIEYKKIWNQKQLDPTSHRLCEINNEEMDELNRLITEKEASVEEVTEVICPEGEVKVARPTQGMAFGAITSCMAISLILDDNTVISAHNGIMARLPGGGIPPIQQIVDERANEVKPVRVIAIGVGDMWDSKLRSQLDAEFEADDLISDNEEKFLDYLQSQLNAPAEFHQHDEGGAGISVDRRYIQG